MSNMTSGTAGEERTAIKAEEGWFESYQNVTAMNGTADRDTIRQGFALDHDDLLVLEQQLRELCHGAKEQHHILLGEPNQSKMTEALKTIDVSRQKRQIVQRRAKIPPSWLERAMFTLLGECMMDWRELELSKRNAKKKVTSKQPRELVP
jgi:hypothetical protein